MWPRAISGLPLDVCLDVTVTREQTYSEGLPEHSAQQRFSHADHRKIATCVRRDPLQELRNAVDLVVMFAVWESQEFKQKCRKPVGSFGKKDVSGLNLGRLGHHAIRFAALRFLANRARHALRQIVPKILQKRHARARILDQDRFGAVLRPQDATLRRRSGYSRRPRNTSTR